VVLCAQGDERLMRLFSEHADHNRRLFVQECKRILPWCDPANSTRVLQDSAAVTVTLAGLPFPCLAPRAEPRQSDRVEQDQGATESGDPQAYREGVGKKNDNDVDFLLDELPNRDAELSPHTTPRSSVAHRQPENVASKTISVDLLDRASSAYSAADATPHQAHLFTVFSTLLTMTDSGEVTEVGPTSLETSGKESGRLSFLAAPLRSGLQRTPRPSIVYIQYAHIHIYVLHSFSLFLSLALSLSHRPPLLHVCIYVYTCIYVCVCYV